MKTGDFESPQRTSSRIPSVTSSRIKLGAFGRVRKTGCERNVASALLQQRQAFRVIHENVDVTPKPLVHAAFSTIDENQTTALETIGLFQTGSASQLMTSPSRVSGLRTSSSILLKSFSITSDDLQMESLLSTQICEFVPTEEVEEAAPSPFFLPSDDSAIFATRPEAVTITLRETQTFFVFEMPQMTEDLQTPEGQAIVRENENYEYVTVGPGSDRKLLNVETQTIRVLTKSRGTYCGLRLRKNQGMFVNNWVIHDTYAAPELMIEKNGRMIVHTKESMWRMREAQELRYKLPEPETVPDQSPEEQLSRICRETGFLDAACVMERIIANNVFAEAQKRFTGLIKRDPCDLNLEFDYRLDLLWTFACEIAHDRPVTAFCWSPANASVLAVAYGAKTGADKIDGVLLIWSAKNPSQPGREYTFDSPLSDMNWSAERPNLLAIGFYDGSLKVIDVSAKEVNVIRQSHRETSAACSPHWQVQWWSGDEQFDYQEQIYTSDQDGRIYCYRLSEDFFATEIMRLYRIEGKLAGVSRTDHCVAYDVPISRQPGALILRRHPIVSNVYFVGSDEGCVYRCSTNYLRQHIDSFLAHDGPIYSFEFSPFCQKLFLTCGADWCIRVWAESIAEPLITLSTAMACVRNACWSPTCSTIIASVVNDQICVWDIYRKTHTPTSVTVSPNGARLIAVDFTANGNQLVIADVEGTVYVYNLEGMPFPPYDQTKILIEAIHKALATKPELLRKLKKLGPPF
ncbi:PREDICTED: WD repeat-containing protein 78-like isoform X1 [Wasmannia auropunctata]|uniref:WD repeat-containing protein 78-like isoform X1 n=1 Tax=Wasmannia auropunctata TaxID=64793 RepID=UPI0005EF1A90|nr:PREDICTED: WD repeat-containing protein 78-like isoform X1 [Wasmannia auropunctata]XP_011694765.1 PREDICTED: WD repeat-containing protein 78-like isoform X1 [Wasmannia auropunctata]XP_011694766.1 PREDICTED: WD repeat-containing protein 78-like isoform X1 [Wasmannia auropunctata]